METNGNSDSNSWSVLLYFPATKNPCAISLDTESQSNMTKWTSLSREQLLFFFSCCLQCHYLLSVVTDLLKCNVIAHFESLQTNKDWTEKRAYLNSESPRNRAKRKKSAMNKCNINNFYLLNFKFCLFLCISRLGANAFPFFSFFILTSINAAMACSIYLLLKSTCNRSILCRLKICTRWLV